MTPDTATPFDITDVVGNIGAMVERVLTADNEAELLGPALHRVRTSHHLPRRVVVMGALLNDFARVAHSCVVADGRITNEELAQVYPIFSALLSFLPKVRPEYERFEACEPDEMRELMERYAADGGEFGARCDATQWVGLDLCRRTARATGDEEPLELYTWAQQRTMDGVFELGGLTPEESAARARLDAKMEVRRKLVESPLPKGADPRIAAYCDPKAPAVFGAIAHAHQVWDRDPFDVESVHAEARETFERLVDRVTAPDGDGRGRMLVVRGPSGAGKTHLMRAFRGYLHGRRLGFAAYLQMTTRADDYARYVLVNLIDALERPYDPPEVEVSGLITLSDALAEDRRALSAAAIEDLREGDFDLRRVDKVSPLVDELLALPEYQDFDPDLLRVFLFLQRRDPRIRARVIKYLRCEHLNDYDRQLLGGIAPRTDGDAPQRMVQQLGQLMSRLGRSALVLLVDQMEDVFNLDETSARITQSVDALRRIVDHVPTAVVVLSCLNDYYEEVRQRLTRSALDRLELDPPPVTLSSGRGLEEIQEIVGVRLAHLYERMGVRPHEDDPTFPIQLKELEVLVNHRTRDVLDWCRAHQQRYASDGRGEPTSVSPEPLEQSPPVVRLAQAWNDFRFVFAEDVPEDDEPLLELLSRSAAVIGEELEPAVAIATSREAGALVVTSGDRARVVAICNKDARGGGLLKQLEALEKLAGGRPVGIARCSEFPSNARTQVFKQIGTLIGEHGRRVTVEDAEWRTMMAYRQFAAEHGHDPGFAQWRRDERPLSQLGSLRLLLDLEDLQDRARASEPPPVVLAGAASPEVNVPPAPPEVVPPGASLRTAQPEQPGIAAEPPILLTNVARVSEPVVDPPAQPLERPAPAAPATTIRVGQIAGLSPRPVAMELGDLVTHAAFLGSTGSGKTTLALSLIEQALERGIPALLLDRKGDLATYARAQWWASPSRDPDRIARGRALAERVAVEVFTPGAPEGRDLALTLVPRGLSDMAPQERAKACSQAAAAIGTMLGYKGTGADQTRQTVLAKALEVLGQVSSKDVGLEQIVALIAEEDPALVNAVGRLDTKHFSKLVDHLETLRLSKGELSSSRAELLYPAKLLGIGREDGKTQLGIVSTKFLGDNAAIDFWVSRMLSELARWASRCPSPKLQALVMFDEADIYLPATRKPATKEPMQDLLRRARSAGLGVMLATQSPGDLDYKSRDNIRTWFLGRVAENTAIAKMQPLLSECRTNVKGKLARQGIGEFFMVQGGSVTELKADRSLMDTEQLAEDEIRELARRSAGRP